MAWTLIFWLLCFLANFGLLAFLFHQLLYLTDLEADELNLFDATARINRWILPEFVLQGLLCLVFLLTGHWLMFLLAAPITCYHVMLFLRRQHLIDVTEVFRNINFEKKFRIVKLVYYLFFVTILMIRYVQFVGCIFCRACSAKYNLLSVELT